MRGLAKRMERVMLFGLFPNDIVLAKLFTLIRRRARGICVGVDHEEKKTQQADA